MKILITGGCGFAGSNIALSLNAYYKNAQVTVLDNLKRRGSELNILRLTKEGIQFVHGDIRNIEDIRQAGKFDVLIDAAAEPSVLAGINSSLDYLIDTNFIGTKNSLQLAKEYGAKVIFLSTSRVYPIKTLEQIEYVETDTRFKIKQKKKINGLSDRYGIGEDFPIHGARSFYGMTKYASELLLQEYIDLFDLNVVINRCGVLTGPYQMGKVDQGVVTLWMAKHFWKKQLSYIGFGGSGKQVRDIMHIDDLSDLLIEQLDNFDLYNKGTFNVGGGTKISISLKELTDWCVKITGNTIPMKAVAETRVADIPIYISDCRKIKAVNGWKPTRSVKTILQDIQLWLEENEKDLKPLLA